MLKINSYKKNKQTKVRCLMCGIWDHRLDKNQLCLDCAKEIEQ